MRLPEEPPAAEENPSSAGIEPAGRPGTIEMPRPGDPAPGPSGPADDQTGGPPAAEVTAPQDVAAERPAADDPPSPDPEPPVPGPAASEPVPEPAEPEPADAEQADAKQADAKQADAKQADAKQADAKQADAEEPYEPEPTEFEPAEPEPADAELADAEPYEPEPYEPEPADRTRWDMPLPTPPAPPAPRTSPEQDVPVRPEPPGPPVMAGMPAPPAPAGRPAGWHRRHYPIGVFLIVYGVTSVLATLIGWADRDREIASYLTETAGIGDGFATPLLILIKAVQVLLTLAVLGGMLRRKDVWLLPALAGWAAGFAVFCVLDLWAGFMGRLLEHLVYLLVLGGLLMLSYTLSVKVRIGGPAPPAQVPGAPQPPSRNLSRTQEMALAALDRWQRGIGQDTRNSAPRAGSPSAGSHSAGPPSSGPS